MTMFQDENRHISQIDENYRNKIGARMKALLAVTLLFLGFHIAGAQNDTIRKIQGSNNHEYYLGPLIHHFPMIDKLPPLSSDMPFDVILAYIVADSVARTTTDRAAKHYLNTEISEEQLYYALKYHYQMVDYNPVLYTQWVGGDVEEQYLCGLGGVRSDLCMKAAQSLSDGRLLSLLAYSDYILHVRIAKVERDSNTSALLARHANLVTAEIIDPIKGAVIPACVIESPQGVRQVGSILASSPGACIEFDYRDEWKRCDGRGNSTRIEGWVEDLFEYIVFLRFIGVQRSPADSSVSKFNARTLSPVGNCLTSVVGMYPIVDGIVIDEQNDFSFGAGLSADEWKARLRSQIFSLINR